MKQYLLLAGVIILLAGAAVVLKPKSTSQPTQEASVVTPTASAEKALGAETYTMDDVAKHNSEQDCWLVIENKVYDVTSFIPVHPGGKEILEGCGKDATSLFQGEREHQEKNAAMYLPKYLIGDLI